MKYVMMAWRKMRIMYLFWLLNKAPWRLNAYVYITVDNPVDHNLVFMDKEPARDFSPVPYHMLPVLLRKAFVPCTVLRRPDTVSRLLRHCLRGQPPPVNSNPVKYLMGKVIP